MKTSFINISLFIAIIVNLSDEQQSYTVSRKHVVLHNTKPVLFSTITLKNSSVVSCSVHCFGRTWCLGGSYNSNNKDCHLHNETTFAYDHHPDWKYITFCVNLKTTYNHDYSRVVAFLPLTKDFMENQNSFTISGTASTRDLSECNSPLNPVLFVSQNQEFLKIRNNGLLTLNSSFTWTAWFKPFDTSDGPLFNYQSSSGLFQTHIWYMGQRIALRIEDVYNPNTLFTSKQELGLNQWNRIGLSFNQQDGKVSCIINGKTFYSVIDLYVNITPTTDGDVFIGNRQHYDPRSLNGYLAWVCLYNEIIELTTIAFTKVC